MPSPEISLFKGRACIHLNTWIHTKWLSYSIRLSYSAGAKSPSWDITYHMNLYWIMWCDCNVYIEEPDAGNDSFFFCKNTQKYGLTLGFITALLCTTFRHWSVSYPRRETVTRKMKLIWCIYPSPMDIATKCPIVCSRLLMKKSLKCATVLQGMY